MSARWSLGVGLFALLTCAGAAHAQTYDPAVEGEQGYRLQGEHSGRGAFESQITLTPTADGIEVVRTEGQTQLRGVGELRGDQLRVQLKTFRGAAGALEQADPAQKAELRLRFHADGTVESRLKDRTGTAEAKGQRIKSEAGSGEEEEDDDGLRGKVKQTGKHLVSLAEKELKKLAYKGEAIEETFKISDYFHLGVGVKLRALDPAKQTAEQKAAVAEAAQRSAWLVTEIEGGPRIPLSASIPVGGGVSLGVGFEAGARVNYTVAHLYELPEGIKDVGTAVDMLEGLAKRSYDLPLDWAEAAAMPQGSQMVLDGQGSLAVSGHLQLGHHVTDFGDSVVRIGASARLGGFYRVQGRLKFEVYRLAGDQVRLRILRSKGRSRGASADLFLGAAVDRGEVKAELDPAVDYFDNALVRKAAEAGVDAVVGEVAGRVERALRVQIHAGSSNSTRDDVNLSWRFDLSKEPAQRAYDRAVRGDLTLAESLRRDPASGVVREYRVLEVADTQHLAANIGLSILLGAGAKRDVKITDLDVEEGNDQQVHYDLFTFNRRRYLSLIGKKLKLEEHRSREVTVDVVRRTEASGRFARSFRFTYSLLDPYTTKGEGEDLRRLVRYWKLNDDPRQPMPKFRLFSSRYGETRTKILVDITEEGLERLLGVTDITQFMAYIESYQAVHGKTPAWADPETRERLRDRWSDDDQPGEDWDRKELERAETFVIDLQKLASAKDADDRAEQLKKLAKNMRYSLMGIATIVRLAPREALSVQVSMSGEKIQVGDAWEGARSAGPLRVGDPR